MTADGGLMTETTLKGQGGGRSGLRQGEGQGWGENCQRVAIF